MPAELIDLDATGVVAAPIQIKLHGTTYQLPGDIPATLYVRMVAAASMGDAADSGTATALHDELLAAFQLYQPDVDSLPLGLNEMVRVVNVIYSSQRDSDGDGDDTPPTNPAKTKTARRRSTSPS